MRNVTVAATQFTYGADKAEELVRGAAKAGAQIILLQELFEAPYFCQKQLEGYIELAVPTAQNSAVKRFQSVAKELGVVLPVTFFERHNNACYNTAAIIDADGSIQGTYRKSHIPDGPGYSEKFYFNPGDTGFKVWDTAYARIGVGICWDQWFPEAARIFALRGAELLFYPTAIGSEPLAPEVDSMPHWRTAMQGHAAANLIPLIASNRVGTETEGNSSVTFYGSSFIADNRGQLAAELNRNEAGFITAAFELDALKHQRRAWGVFRDRRPDLYAPLLTSDGG